MSAWRPQTVKLMQSVTEFEPFYNRLMEQLRNEFGSVKQVPSAIDWDCRSEPGFVSTIIGCQIGLANRKGDDEALRESWTLDMFVTSLPFVYFRLQDWIPHRRLEVPSTRSFITRLLEIGLADFTPIDRGKSFVGSLWSIYFASKIERHKALSSSRMRVPAPSWQSRSIAADFIDKLKEVLVNEGNHGGLETIDASRRAMKVFLANCDKVLMDKWGDAEFSQNLAPLGISLRDWLKIA